MSERKSGTVKFFNNDKGFGFISPDDGSEDLFVHQSQIKSSRYRSLADEEKVEFEVEEEDSGRCKAVNVTGPGGIDVQGRSRDGAPGSVEIVSGYGDEPVPLITADGKKTGVVKFFNNDKGFGFITPNDGTEDLFVHQAQLKSKGFRSLAEGEQVEFNVEESDDGRTKAIDVTGPHGAFVRGVPRPPKAPEAMSSGGAGGDSWGGGGDSWGNGEITPKAPRPDIPEITPSGKHTGFVRAFDDTKGFGFISPTNGGVDLFVHQSELFAAGFRSLAEDEIVEFDIEESSDGRTKAINVTGPNGSFVKGNPSKENQRPAMNRNLGPIFKGEPTLQYANAGELTW